MIRTLIPAVILSLFPAAGLCAPVNGGIFAPERLESVLGQDGVTPIPFRAGDGSSALLWTFGDTLLGGWKGPVVTTATLNFNESMDMTSMPCNTMAVSPALSSSNYKSPGFSFYAPGGKVREFIDFRKGENPFVKRMWAAGGAQVGSRVYVYYMDVRTDKTVPGGFVFEGAGLARSEVPEKAEAGLFSFERVDGFNAPGLAVGDSVIRRGKYLYVLGRISRSGDGKLGSLCIMRVKPRHIEDFSRYEFLTSRGRWSRRSRGAFFDDVGGEPSLVFDPFSGVFRIVYMSFAEQAVKAAEFRKFRSFARAPGAETVYHPPEKEGALYYSAKEVFQERDYFSIIYMDPSVYQPVLVDIPRKDILEK